MPRVIYRQPDGSARTVHVTAGETVLDGALDNVIEGIIGQCGGAMNCLTCHCYVAPEWRDRVPPPEEDEAEMLDYVVVPGPGGRLGCQLHITDALDGLTVQVPIAQLPDDLPETD